MKTHLALSWLGAVSVCALLARAAGADPGTIVSFAWSTAGTTDATAGVGCNIPNPPPGCDVQNTCSSSPAPGFSLGGSSLGFLQTAAEGRTNCVSSCTCCIGGAGATGASRSSPLMFDPVTSASSTVWRFGGEIIVTSSASAPPPDWCALGTASSLAQSEHHWALEFDVGGDTTLLVLQTHHGVQIIGPDVSATSTIRLRDASDGVVYERIVAPESAGGVDASEAVSVVLGAGRYRLTIDSAASATHIAASAGVHSAAGSAIVDASCHLTLSPYQCASFTTPPQDASVCPGGDALFVATASGTGPHTYQWRRNGTPLVNGADYFGVNAPFLTVLSAHESDEGDYDCIVTDFCGATTSQAARLIVSLDGDFDDDGDVDFADLNRVLGGYNVTYTFADLNAVLSNYNSTC